MAIVKFTFDQNKDFYPEGAFTYIKPDSNQHLTVWEEHVGYCLHEREINGYDDSDFMMLIWDPVEKRAYETMFATTRGWCGPAFGSSVDASDEVREEYKAWVIQEREKSRLKFRMKGIKRRHQNVKEMVSVAKKSGLTYTQVKKVKCAYVDTDLTKACFKLLTSKLRSNFRISLKEQLIAWAKGERGDYAAPFSYKQLQYI